MQSFSSIQAVVSEEKIFEKVNDDGRRMPDDGRRTTDDDGRKVMTKAHIAFGKVS